MSDINTATASLASLATALNDGTPATFTPADTVARLTTMEAAAADMGVTIGKAEAALADSAKAFGCDFLNLSKVHGIDGDTLAKRARTAMGWADLAGATGSKVKTCFNTMRSRLGIVSGEWDNLEQTVRDELLGGLRSYNTVYDAIKSAEREALKAKKAAEAAEEKRLADIAASAGNDDAKPETDTAPSIVVSFEAFEAFIRNMSLEQAGVYADRFEALAVAWDARLNALTEAAPAVVNG